MIHLESLRDYVGRFNINNTILTLKNKINLTPGIVILGDSAKAKLNDLAQSGLSDIKFYQYAELLKDNITSINLEHLAHKLREVWFTYWTEQSQAVVTFNLYKNSEIFIESK